ncbi:leucine-rich repeat protein [Gordonibacter faecis]|uniref:Leucine-rich repeat protein n=1 Tax=Gordonibacter faecis TaxID=3047475 RepID=A0ABT7DMA6_9ACTN|nr:leucine-rich repeat protein [Gordonibacter sp. KGMB12511]MDJ1650667.1 leucine-rich repeat protein [Gordonibacter sp. KGMB12511]
MLWRPVLCLHSQAMLQHLKTSGGGGGLSEPIASETSDATSAEGAAESPNASDVSQFSQQVPLDQSSSNENQTENSPVQDAGSTGVSSQVAGTVPLPEGSADAVASIVADGLVFEIDTTVNTAKLVGSAVTPPKGDLSVPPSVTSGSTTYEVTSIAKEAFAKCAELTSISLPATLREVDPDAVAGCTSLKSITISAKNEAFASHDGMLFSKDYSRLLLIPEGKEGAATIPGQTTYVPAQAFSRCLSSSLTAGDGSAEFTTLNGMLFSKDLKTLVVCPPKVGNAVVLPTETETIGEYALAGCKDLTSITALGNVREIDPTAFADETKATAVVALPAGESKAVWEQAGFQHFAEPAEPGTTSRPEVNDSSEAAASGFVFTLLDDYTLSVTWEGTEDPAVNLEIPASAKINDVSYRVSTIAANAFANRGSLTSVKLPESVTSISEAAFARCANLATIQLPDTLREIGERAFEATALAEVWLPASIQSIASRAFASCESLTRIVALGTPEVVDDAIAGCANLSIYSPYNAEGTYPWNLGLIANNNHLLPYGLTLPEEPLHLEVGQSANLFEGDLHETPEPCEVSFSYAAKPLSVAPDGTVTAKAPGTSEVTVTLTLNNQELTRATRTVVVSASSEPVIPSGPEASEKQESVKTEELLNAQTEHTVQTPATEPSIALANELDPTTISLETGELVNESGMIQRAAMLATGESFEQEVASGHTLKFTVLSEAEGEMSGEVAVSKSANAALDPRGSLIVPATVENNGSKYQVTAIADNGFSTSFYLNSISFAAGSTLSSLGIGSFNNCRSLSQVALPDTVKSIGASAFTNCTSLTDIDVSSAVSIGKECFLTCTSLSSVALGAQVTSLAPYIFSNCRSLRTVYVYGTITSFEEGAFDLLPTQDVSVYVSNADSAASWSEAAGAAGYTFKTVEVLGERCSVTFDSQGGMPASFVQTVAKGVPIAEPSSPIKEEFSLSGWFTSEGIRWDFSQPIENNMTLYGQWVEEATDGTFLYRMRSDGKSLSIAAINPSSLTGHVVIPSEYELGGLVFPVEEVAQFALYRSQVSSLVIPKSIKEIGNQAVSDCPQLTSVTFEEGSSLRIIKTSAFSKSTLTAIDIPDTVETLEASVFHACPKLQSVKLPSRLTTIEPFLFCFCQNLSSVNIPRGITSVGGHAFQNCLLLESVDLPDAITTIRDYAFTANQSLKSINLSQVTSIGAYAFNDCRSLETVSLPATRVLGTKAFRLCAKLTSVDMPVVEHIGAEAFSTCGVLASINFPSSLQAVDASAFTDSNAIAFIRANSSLPNVGIATAFDDTVKAKAVVILPRVSTDGNATPYNEMKAAWENYGFLKISPMGGALPLASDDPNSPNTDENKAGWTLSDDGTLTIHSTETIANLGWAYTDGSSGVYEKYWGPVRAAVTRVSMEAVTGVEESMECWFQEMPNLVEAVGVRVFPGVTSVAGMFQLDSSLETIPVLSFPDSVTSVRGCFQRCSSLKEIPEGFTLPKNVEDCSYIFNSCSNLTDLPSGFSFPNSIEAMAGFFAEWVKLETVPTSFTFPSQVKRIDYLFQGCKSLSSLPEGFSLPSTAINADSVFYGCSSLVSLPDSLSLAGAPDLQSARNFLGNCTSLVSIPDDFKIPDRITDISYLFYNCVSLVALPDGFGIPAEVNTHGMFALYWTQGEQLPGNVRVPLYYAGSNTILVNEYNWASSNRTLVTPTNRPDGASVVTLNIKEANETGAGSFWTATYTDASSMLVEPPYVPTRPGMVFTLWYADPECTQRVDFSQPFGADVTIYGKLAPGTHEGELPCEASTGAAAWSISDDGTLFIRGAGIVDKSVRWTEVNDSMYSEYWGPYRSQIEKVSMTPALRARNLSGWFAFMDKLTNAVELHIPEGVTGMRRSFQGCSSLETLPEGWALPGTVVDTSCMFERCVNLTSLPRSFVLNRGVQTVQYMFWQCSSLASLPENFGFPESVTASASVFGGCLSLSVLPDGLTLPTAVWGANNPFYCDIDPGEPRIPTYYAGSDPGVLTFDWESQNRTLITDESDMGIMQQGVFKMQMEQPDGSFAWETRSTAWSNKQGILADPGAPVHPDGYAFTGWCTDEDCLTPFDFTQPLTERTTLYGKWVLAGGKNDLNRAGGELPCVDAAGQAVASTAWWRVTADGALFIEGEGEVANLAMTWDSSAATQTFWEPVRDQVKSIRMDKRIKAQDMSAWFCRMPLLVDLSGFAIPEGTRTVKDMFYRCASLAELPAGFRLPDSLESAHSLFLKCASLASVPASFTLPDVGNLKEVSKLFGDCVALTSLPVGFTIPTSVTFVDETFFGCTSLASLPEGFTIPASVTKMHKVFCNCPTLTVLPASFDFPQTVAEEATEPFWCAELTPTYFAGAADSTSNVLSYSKWDIQNRSIATNVPDGQVLVELMCPEAETGTYGLYAQQLAAAGATLTAPDAPNLDGFAFAGWYNEESCTTAFDFSQPLTGNVKLYAKYVGRSGLLPTTDGGENASWKLTDDGTLVISCEPGAIIKELWAPADEFRVNYWGPMRDEVTAAIMEPNVQAESMAKWFQAMVNLEDVSRVYVPSGTTSLRNTFSNCAKIVNLPEDFTIPSGAQIVDMHDTFIKCTSLTKLPDGLRIPDSVQYTDGMLFGCTSLTTLPAGFNLPASLINAENMFCLSGLTTLPAGFEIPQHAQNLAYMFANTPLTSLPASFRITGDVTSCSRMFSGCESLRFLPEGFSVPVNVSNAGGMFRGCRSLESLPEGFAIEGANTDVAQMFMNCPKLCSLPASFKLLALKNGEAAGLETMFGMATDFPGFSSETLTTWYAGATEDVLGADYWLTTYNRTLVTANDPLPANTYKVTFKLADSVGAVPVEWMKVLVTTGEDGSAHVVDPGVPQRFGYIFSGWKTADGTAFDFSSAITQDMELIGEYVLSVDIDVPLAAKVEVDSSGNVTPAVFKMRSNTPVALSIASVSSEAASGAEKLFPNAAERAGVQVRVKVGQDEALLAFDESKGPLSNLPAATVSSPTLVDAEIGLNRNGAQLDFQPGEDITSFAKLIWTIVPEL